MSKKNLIMIAGGVGVLLIIIIFIVVKGNMKSSLVSNDAVNQVTSSAVSTDPANTQSPASNAQEIPADISWVFQGYVVDEHTTNEVTSNTVSVNVNGQTFNIGTYAGKSEEITDFATYDMPANTLSACKSVLQTGGDYFYIVRKDKATLSVMTRFMDDAIQKADNTKTAYTEKMTIQIPQPTSQPVTQPATQATTQP